MDWQPIATAPLDGTAVLISAPGAGVGEAYYHAETRAWWWANTCDGDYHAEPVHHRFTAPTHWMPLPEPPKS